MCAYIYIYLSVYTHTHTLSFSLADPPSSSAGEGSGTKLLAVPPSARALYTCLICVASCLRVCICVYIYIYVVYASAYWEFIFSLAAGWTREHGAAPASPPSGCQILLDNIFLLTLSMQNNLGRKGGGDFLHLKSLESYLQKTALNKYDSARKIKQEKLKTGKAEVSFKTSVWLLGAATSYSFNYILPYYTFYRILHYPVHSMNNAL